MDLDVGLSADELHEMEDLMDIGSGMYLDIYLLQNFVQRGRKDMVDIYLDHGVGINYRGMAEHCPIHVAVDTGNMDMISHLISRGADVTLPTDSGKLPIDIAMEKDNWQIVELLISHGGECNILHSEFGNKETIKKLLDSGANIDKVNEDGFTILHTAITANDMGMVKFLLGLGANMGMVAGSTMTAIHVAVNMCSREMVELSPETDIPLHNSRNRGYLDMVEILLAHGADINATDITGRKAIHYAAKHSDVICIRTLMDHGADIKAVDNYENTPLHYAAGSNPQAILAILAYGADIFAFNSNYELPLNHATGLEVIKLLVIEMTLSSYRG